MDRQINRYKKDKLIDRWVDRLTDKKKDKLIDRWINR